MNYKKKKKKSKSHYVTLFNYSSERTGFIFLFFYFRGTLQLAKIGVVPVTAINFYPDGPEKTAEKLQDKPCV